MTDQTPMASVVDDQTLQISDAAFIALSERLEATSGIVLSDAKRGLAVSRLARRLRALGLPNFESYCALLDGPNGHIELREMVELLTTNVTRFFREQHHFDALKSTLSAILMDRVASGEKLRFWSAGCSSGEEAFSMAMVVNEMIPDAEKHDVRILATDIDTGVLETARAARYRVLSAELSKNPLLEKCLVPVADTSDHFEVVPHIRALVQFGELNLIDDWPMKGQFDVIFCRNVVIYFSTQTQRTLWPRFADALCPGGHLMIGHSERVTGAGAKMLTSTGVTQYTRTS